jgi:hypothetical protein
MRRGSLYNYGHFINSSVSVTSNPYTMSSTIISFIRLDSPSKYGGMKYHGYYDVYQYVCYAIHYLRLGRLSCSGNINNVQTKTSPTTIPMKRILDFHSESACKNTALYFCLEFCKL